MQLNLHHVINLMAAIPSDALVTFKSDGYSPNGIAVQTGGSDQPIVASYAASEGALTLGEWREQAEDDFAHPIREFFNSVEEGNADHILEAILLSRVPRDPERTIPIPLVGFEYRVDGSLPSLVLIEQGE